MKRLLILALIASAQLSAGPLSAFFSAPAVMNATATDASNNLYIAGYTTKGTLPVTAGAFLTSFPACQSLYCQHSFLAKFSSSGKLVFATYVGDFDTGDYITAISVDASQDIYIAIVPLPGGTKPSDGFIYELSSDGTKLLARAAPPGVQPSALAIGPSGDIFAAGYTTGPQQVPTTPGAFQAANRGGTDAFVIRFDAALSKTLYATLLGGAGNDLAYGLAVDAQGEAYVTGTTSDMRSFPMTPGALLQYSSAQDVFVVKLNTDGSALIFSALFGPDYNSAGVAIAVDSSGIYVAGVTSGIAFPLPQNAFLRTGSEFAAKLSPDGSSLLYETLLPGRDSASLPNLFQISVDGFGKLLIFSSSNRLVPTTPDSFSPCTNLGGDKFVLQLDSAGTGRDYGSYVPGGLAIRSDGQVWYSDTSGAVNSFNIHDPLPAGVRCVSDALTFYKEGLAPGKLVSLFGPDIGPEEPANLQLDASGKVGTYLGGVSVYFNGIAAPLLYASKNQINAVVPFEIAGAPTSSIAILKDGVVLRGADVGVSAVAPGFALTSEGCVAAVNPDGSINSAAHPAIPGSFVSVFGEGAGLMNPAATGGIGDGTARIAAHVSAEIQVPGTGFPGAGPPITAPVSVLYAGDAPGAVQGVFQLNLQLPDSFYVGRQSIRIYIGQVSSGMCLWIGRSS